MMIDVEQLKCKCTDINGPKGCACYEFASYFADYAREISKITQNCVWGLDQTGAFRFVAGKVEEIIGFPASSIIGKQPSEFFVFPDKETPYDKYHSELLENRKVVTDFHLYAPATQSHVLINAAPKYDKSGQFQGVVGILRAINTRIEIEENLCQSNLELQNKNIALREVLSQLETEKKSIHQNLAANVEKFIKPLLRSLRNSSNLTPTQMKTVDSIEQLLNELNWDFFRKLDHLGLCLTPAELQVCRLIQSRYSIKEIAGIQSISLETAKTHCKNIRRKIGLKGRKTSLASFFQQL